MHLVFCCEPKRGNLHPIQKVFNSAYTLVAPRIQSSACQAPEATAAPDTRADDVVRLKDSEIARLREDLARYAVTFQPKHIRTCHVDVDVDVHYDKNPKEANLLYCCSVGGEKDGLRTQLRQAMETVDRLTLECRALEPVAAEVHPLAKAVCIVLG
jgi:hypothetical protein